MISMQGTLLTSQSSAKSFLDYDSPSSKSNVNESLSSYEGNTIDKVKNMAKSLKGLEEKVITTPLPWHERAWIALKEGLIWLVTKIIEFFQRLFGIEATRDQVVREDRVGEAKSQMDQNSENLQTIKDTVNKVDEIILKTVSTQTKIAAKSHLALGPIPNVGNSCYMNSCIQSIMGSSLKAGIAKELPKPEKPAMKLGESIESFTKRLELYARSINDWTKARKVQDELRNFTTVYDISPDSPDRSEILRASAIQLRQTIFESKIVPALQLNGIFKQHDAPECMLALMTALGTDFNLSIKTASTEEPKVFSVKTEISRIWEVEIGTEKISFQKLIDHYSIKEIIDDSKNPWTKDDKKYSKYTREHRISGEIPEIIVIQLKRMAWDDALKIKEKISTTITWDTDEVNLSTILDPVLYSKGESTSYRLTAYVNHHGLTPGFGHYTANVCDEMTWFKLDDGDAPSLRLEEEKSDREQAYLFVLERKK
jgi:uncharacterized UBP type Zn finger protein